MTRADPERCPLCGGSLGAPLLCSPDRFHGSPGTFAVVRCGSCGVGVTLPVAVGAAQLATFYPTTYGAYGLPTGLAGLLSRLILRLQARRALRTPPLASLTQLPPGRLLDVGCGRGDLGVWFLGRGWRAVGVEPSAAACALARRRGVHAREGTLDVAELEPDAFDAVVFRQSLEHVPDPLADLRRAATALRRGGLLAVSVPNFGCWQRRRFRGRWFHLDLPRHRFHFDAAALREALVRAGFEDVRVSTSFEHSRPPGLAPVPARRPLPVSRRAAAARGGSRVCPLRAAGLGARPPRRGRGHAARGRAPGRRGPAVGG